MLIRPHGEYFLCLFSFNVKRWSDNTIWNCMQRLNVRSPSILSMQGSNSKDSMTIPFRTHRQYNNAVEAPWQIQEHVLLIQTHGVCGMDVSTALGVWKYAKLDHPTFKSVLWKALTSPCEVYAVRILRVIYELVNSCKKWVASNHYVQRIISRLRHVSILRDWCFILARKVPFPKRNMCFQFGKSHPIICFWTETSVSILNPCQAEATLRS